MSEFTKEELEGMLYLIDDREGCYGKFMNGDLREKIQSMINNYCEHEEKISSPDDNGHIVIKCRRCDYVLWHEKD